MKNKLILILTAGILIPLGTTFLMGWQALVRDQENSVRRVQDEMTLELKAKSDFILKALEAMEVSLSPLLDLDIMADPATLMGSNPLVQAVYHAQGAQVVYPPLVGGTKKDEVNHQKFQNLLDKGFFSTTSAGEENLKISRSVPQNTPSEGWATSREEWESYYFWKRVGLDLVVVECNRSAFYSSLLDSLFFPGPLPEGHMMKLLDDRRRIFYQTGSVATTNAPLVTIIGPHPLETWVWEYYLDPLLIPGLGQGLWWLLGLSALGLTGFLAFLLWFLNREIGRELREAGEKVSFVNQVSHELKTPLTNIRLYAELLGNQLEQGEKEQNTLAKNRTKTDLQATEYIQIITAETDRLSRMIHNVLTFARKGKANSPQISWVNLTELISGVLMSFHPSFKARNLEILWAPLEEIYLQTDPDWLGQILANLVSNGEKYGAPGGKIEITLGIAPPVLQLRVRDWGPGVPPNDQDRIFLPFQRLTDKITEGTSGAGLGLTISRELAQKLGGKLFLENGNPGACFVLELPWSPGENEISRPEGQGV